MKTQRNRTKRAIAGPLRFPERTDEKKIVAAARELAEPLCGSEGLELVHVEYRREAGGRVLRFFIDRAGGVNLQDCVNVSRQLNDLLDVYIEQLGSYRLEVSSPGPERPLSRKEDFERFRGSRVRIRTAQPVGGRRNFTGVLAQVTADGVKLQLEQGLVAIDWPLITRARLAAENTGQ